MSYYQSHSCRLRRRIPPSCQLPTESSWSCRLMVFSCSDLCCSPIFLTAEGDAPISEAAGNLSFWRWMTQHLSSMYIIHTECIPEWLTSYKLLIWAGGYNSTFSLKISAWIASFESFSWYCLMYLLLLNKRIRNKMLSTLLLSML